MTASPHPKLPYISGLPGQRCSECPWVKNLADPARPKYYCMRQGTMIKVYAEGTCRQRILETAANQDELIAQAGLLAMADTLCRAGWVLRLEGNSHDGWTAQFGSIRNPLYCGATLSKALASAVRWAWAQGYGEAA